ncbi:MAG: O-antigen ligase family protein [Pirellulaceae bacterium]|nr:O-antigen ligase family protein [Pirellulaceae bacterium]
MATRKSKSNSRARATQESPKQLGQPFDSLSATGKRWWGASAGLLGVLLVWSLLQPADATSVFQGTAIPQNLGWLVLATLTASGCIACGVRYEFNWRSWCWVSAGLIWLVIATVLAGGNNNPRVAWNGFWQVIALGACYFSTLALLPGPKSRLAALQILLVGCLALALQGLEQVFVEMPAERAKYLADPEAMLARNPDLDLPVGSPMRKRFEDRLLYSSEPYATFALTNSLAVLLSGGLVLLCGLGVAGWRRQLGNECASNSAGPSSLSASAGSELRSWLPLVRETDAERRATLSAGSGPRRWLPLFALSLAVLVIGVCWFLTRSRVAYLAVAVGGLAWLLTGGKRMRANGRLVAGALAVGGLTLVAAGLWLWRNDRLVLREAPKSLSYRLEYWAATLDMLGDHGLWGVGLGNFQSYYPAYKLPAASEIIADPHNWPLDLCVSLSLPVGILLIGWLGMRLLGFGELAESEVTAERLSAVDMLDAWSRRCLLWGASLGGALCLGLLGLLSGLAVPVLAVTWLVSAGLIGLLRPLLMAGQATMPGTARAAVLTMLACLLVSGSWQASGLSVPILVCLVIADRNGAENKWRTLPVCGLEITSWKLMSQQVAIVVLPALGLLCFLLQCWRPTTMSWSLVQQAQVAPSARAQLVLVEAAAAADRLDTEPLQLRAQLLAGEAARAASDQFVPLAEQTLAAFDVWLARDPTKYLNWELAGKHALELAGHAQRLGLEPKRWLEAGLGCYEQAVARYPSSIGLHSQLAATLAIAARWREAEQQWEMVYRLDEATVHEDRKLASQQLWIPLLPIGADEGLAAEFAAEFADRQPQIMAEPILDWLRNHSPSQE